MKNTKEAADLFIDIVFNRAYIQLFRDIETTLLPDGFPGIADDSYKISEWYEGIDVNQGEIVKEIIKIVIKGTIFSLLAILDNRIGNPIHGELSEFALYLQNYQSFADVPKNNPKESVRLNLSNTPGYDELEILFTERIRNNT